jgi:hypothetical protein
MAQSTDTAVYRGGRSRDHFSGGPATTDVKYVMDGEVLCVSFQLGQPWHGTSIALRIGPADQAAMLKLMESP